LHHAGLPDSILRSNIACTQVHSPSANTRTLPCWQYACALAAGSSSESVIGMHRRECSCVHAFLLNCSSVWSPLHVLPAAACPILLFCLFACCCPPACCYLFWCRGHACVGLASSLPAGNCHPGGRHHAPLQHAREPGGEAHNPVQTLFSIHIQNSGQNKPPVA
jgi:hypothetical protein